MIRPSAEADTPALLALATETGVFYDHEIEALEEVLDDYHAALSDEGHVCVTFEEAGRALGFAYFAPAAMTDRTWYLWWVAVAPDCQGQGLGSQLLAHAEEEIRRAGGRVLFIETSSQLHYEPTRRFYRKHGYEISGTLRDYYADGDHMVIFRKHLRDPAGCAA